MIIKKLKLGLRLVPEGKVIFILGHEIQSCTSVNHNVCEVSAVRQSFKRIKYFTMEHRFKPTN